MANLPFDIVEDILCRLPVKPLKRFRCVSKTWHSLIDSERFVKSHLNMSLETLSHRHLIAHRLNKVFDVDLADDHLVNPEVSVIKPPFLFPKCVFGILNTCNGLILVNGNPPIIWNPFTKEFKTLPGIGGNDHPKCGRYFWHPSYGLTYDSKHDDYKVVRAVTCLDTHSTVWIFSKAHIYSLKSNSWNQINETFTYPVQRWHANINGALHSIVAEYPPPKNPGRLKIVAFSVESESHYEMELPSCSSTGWVVILALHKIGGRLCLIRATSESSTEVWVMRDYRVSGSWTKMVSTNCMNPEKMVSTDFMNPHKLFLGAMRPLVYTKEGHKVLFCSGHGDTFVLRDCREEKLNFLSIKGLPSELHNVEAFVESLVSLHGEQQVQRQGQVYDDQDKKQDNKKSRKKRDDLLSTGFKMVL